MEEHIEAPSTIKEVGIHIGYMRNDLNDLKQLIETLPSGFASKGELASIDNRVTVLEKAHSKNWFLHSAALAIGALLSFLIQYAVTHQ